MVLALMAAASAALPTTAVGVGLDEFTLAAYRRTVVPGRVAFNITNFGEDPHDFALRTAKGRIVARTAKLLPGERTTLRVRLRAEATHTLVCTLPDHEKLGMRTTIKVRRPKKR